MIETSEHIQIALDALNELWGESPELVLEGLTSTSVDEVHRWVARLLQQTTEMEYAFVGRLSGEDWDRVTTLAVCTSLGLQENFAYDLKGTPCENVVVQGACSHRSNVARQFPDDLLLAEMGVESYVGVPLSDAGGRPLGIIVLLHTAALSDQKLLRAEALLSMFQARVATVMVMQRAVKERDIVLAESIKQDEDVLEQLAKALAHSAHVKVAFVASPVDGDPRLMRTEALVVDGQVREAFEYNSTGTPCERIYAEKVVCLSDGVQDLFPEDKFLNEVGAEGYVAMAFYDSTGNPIGHVGLIHDRSLNDKLIDEPIFKVFATRMAAELGRRNAEHQRLMAERALQHMQRTESLGILAGGIAHDFNNLLQSISGNAELGQTELHNPSRVAEYLDEITRASDRAAALCRQMLAYAGRAALKTETMNLNELVREMAQLLKVSISKKVVLKFDLCDDELFVHVDASQMQQVVMNLIANAADAIGDRVGQITIRTGMDENPEILDSPQRESESRVRYSYLTVQDTGCGMTEEDKARIFEPFFSTKHTGHGLGLAALQGIIRAHSGDVRVESTPGEGSIFKIFLPVTEKTAAQIETKENLGETRRNALILVADDEPGVLRVACAALKQGGFDVVTAVDGDDAVRVFNEHRGQIGGALLDQSMPKMSGEEVLGELRKLEPGLPVLLCSGYEENETLTRVSSLALVDTIQKPYAIADLLYKVHEMLESADEK